MSVYTVHAPQTSAGVVPDPERFLFVRDGFHFWAFVFGPLWLLVKRQWLALLIFIGIAAVLHLVLFFARVPAAAHSVLNLMLHLLVGLEASTIQRWKVSGWTQLGLVSASNREDAERRFFDRWVLQQGGSGLTPTEPTGTPTQISTISDLANLYLTPQPRT